MHDLLAFPATAEYKDEKAFAELEPETLQAMTKLIEPSDYFFTYGTLLRGEARHQVLENEVFEGEAYITDSELYDTGCGFPALFVGRTGMVWGEVYQIIHPEIWASMDRIENGLYCRVARRVHLPGKAPLARHPLAQVYVANPRLWSRDRLSLIPGGRWKTYDPHPRP